MIGCGLISIAHDITAKNRAERERDASEKLLRLINQQNNLQQLTQETAGMLRLWSGCQAVGIRLKAGDEYPYIAALGFDTDVTLMDSLSGLDGAEGEPMPHPRSRSFFGWHVRQSD